MAKMRSTGRPQEIAAQPSPQAEPDGRVDDLSRRVTELEVALLEVAKRVGIPTRLQTMVKPIPRTI